jgi:hypothetical protein
MSDSELNRASLDRRMLECNVANETSTGMSLTGSGIPGERAYAVSAEGQCPWMGAQRLIQVW